MENIVIKNHSLLYGAKIIEYFKSIGVDTRGHKGFIYKDTQVCIYYGVIDNYFNNYSLAQVKKKGIIPVILSDLEIGVTPKTLVGLPKKWAVKGENTLNYNKGIPLTHWFNQCIKKLGKDGNKKIGFYENYYYSIDNFFSIKPTNYIEITKEKLIKYCNIKTEKHHEVSQKITEQRRPRQQGSRTTSQKIKLASSSRLIGSRNTNFRERTGIRTIKISYNKLFSN